MWYFLYMLSVILQVMGCLFVIIFVMTFIAPMLCRMTLRQFDSLAEDRKKDLKLRASTILYASCASSVSFYLLAIDESSIHRDKLWGHSKLAQWNLAMAVGYSFADILMHLKWKQKIDPLMYVHHVYAVGTGGFAFLANRTILYFTTLRIMSEVSTPFLEIIISMHHLGMHNNKIYLVAALLNFLAFAIFRIFLIPFHYYSFYMAEPFSGKRQLDYVTFYWWFTGAVALDILNIHWFIKIFKIYWNYFDKKEKSKS
ncbi:TLC domain-containing protein 4-like [Clavelina lepadiformis]|uniref:TLC domain-containing protein n=1 Tax=Clavelina lepadiformis TaxID=159417 RepID=A0ABP0G5U8_CLALP